MTNKKLSGWRKAVAAGTMAIASVFGAGDAVADEP